MPLKIINIMLGKGLGGIEQAALDYAVALRSHKHDVLFITDPRADINRKAEHQEFGLTHLSNMGEWDILAVRRLKQIIANYKADIVVTHGNRALVLADKARIHRVPVIAVSHNYQMQHLNKADEVICITAHMKKAVLAAHHSIKSAQCHVIPNMVEIQPLRARYRSHFNAPPVIGAMGRMVKKKGFDDWLRALARLHGQGVMFEAWLGGDGEERAALEQLSHSLKLDGVVRFVGWVQHKQKFFEEIDIFCVPSVHEPFGIVLIEAMAAGLPVVATDSEGPAEILEQTNGAVIVPKSSPSDMAAALVNLLASEKEAIAMGMRGHHHVAAHYGAYEVSRKCSQLLEWIADNARQTTFSRQG